VFIVTVASTNILSKFKMINNYLRNSISQDRSSIDGILNMEKDMRPNMEMKIHNFS